MNIVIVGTQNIKKCIFDITDVAFRNPFGKYIFIFALTFQYSVPSLVLSWALSRSFKYSSTLLFFFFSHSNVVSAPIVLHTLIVL